MALNVLKNVFVLATICCFGKAENASNISKKFLWIKFK